MRIGCERCVGFGGWRDREGAGKAMYGNEGLGLGDFERIAFVLVRIGSLAGRPSCDINFVPRYYPKKLSRPFDRSLPHSPSTSDLSHCAPPMRGVRKQSHNKIDQFFGVEFESEFPLRP